MKRLLFILLLALAATAQGGRSFLGTIAEDATIVFYWETFDDAGASVTRATDGTVKLIREDGQDCTAGAVTDAEDSLDTGVHKATIDTSGNVNCTPGSTYFVWIDGAVIDGDTVNAVLATFSIEDRFVNVAEVESTDATTYFESRTLAAADYFLFGTDAVANVTLTGTCTTLTNWDKAGYTLTNLSDANTAKLEDILDGSGITGDVDITMRSLTITNDTGVAIAIVGSTRGVTVSGSGNEGVRVVGATTGVSVGGASHGVDIEASAGPAVKIDGTTFGIQCDASAGPGLHAGGTTFGGEFTASAGPGFSAIATGGNNNGMTLAGFGSGYGFSTIGGATGHGAYFLGGATRGDGFYSAGQTLGHGMTLVGVGALRYDLNADIHGTLDTVSALTGHTAQTGDTFALANGAAGFVAIDTVVDAILVDTGTTIPATLTAMSGAGFATGTHSLVAIRTQGDAAWTTGAGGDATAANQVILLARLTALRAGYLDQLAGAAMPADLTAVLADTNELQGNQGAWLTAVGFSTLTQAQVQARVTAALAAWPAAKVTDVQVTIIKP